MRTRSRILAVALLLLCSAWSVRAAEPPTAVAADLFARAAAAYDAGLATLGSDRAAATAQFLQAAAIYRSLIDEHGAASGSMLYNLGNASLLAGGRGQAMLAFRRAERLIPFDHDLKTAVAVAREKIGSASPEPPARPSWQRALDGARAVPERTRWLIFAGGFGAAWVLALIRLLGCRGEPGVLWRAARWLTALSAIASVLALATIVGEAVGDRILPRGVVTAPTAPTRTGPSEAVHDPGSPAALPGGTEFILLSRVGDADGWSRVRLGNGAEVWVRSASIEMVADSLRRE